MISGTYINRRDLSNFQKHQLTFEEKMRKNLIARTLYKCYLRFSILFDIVMTISFVAIMLVEIPVKKVFGEGGHSDCIGLFIFVLAMGFVGYIHWFGLVFVGCIVFSLLLLWFVSAMDPLR